MAFSFDASKYNQLTDYKNLENQYISVLSGSGESSIVQEIQKARNQIKNSLMQSGGSNRLEQLEKTVDELIFKVENLQKVIDSLTKTNVSTCAKSKSKGLEDDLFGSDDDEDQDRKAILEQYNKKKAAKPQVIAKSSIVLDVKPWGTEIDLTKLEKKVREITKDGLLWGQSKFVDVAFGIKKLQIGCVVEDDKVGTDFLEEAITAFEEDVQSVDVASFQKI